MNEHDIRDAFPGTVKVEWKVTAKERERVREQVISCHRCTLRTTCTAPVPFRGRSGAEIAVVGEAPGKDEDAVGRPFVGKSGRLLDVMLREAGFEDWFICNTNNCRPPGNRTPREDEVAACKKNLWDQLVVGGTRLVLLAGAVATRAVLGDKAKVTALAGQVFRVEERGIEWVVVPTFHPAAMLRVGRLKKDVRGHLARVRELDMSDGVVGVPYPMARTWKVKAGKGDSGQGSFL